MYRYSAIGLFWVMLATLPVSGQCRDGQCYQPATYQNNANVPEWAVKATCRVSDWHGNTASGGTGTVVLIEDKSAYILTCRHVVENGSGVIKVLLSNGQRAEARYLGASPDGADVTVLEISSENVPLAIPVSTQSISRGDDVCQVGWGGGRLNQRIGKVLGTNSRSQNGWRNHWNTEISFPAISGDSGSGVFSLERKELVGVLWGGGGSTSEICGPEYCQRALETCIRRRRRPGNGGGGGVPLQPGGNEPSLPPFIKPPEQQKPAEPVKPACTCDPAVTKENTTNINILAQNVSKLTELIANQSKSIDGLAASVSQLDKRVSALENRPVSGSTVTRIVPVKP